MQPINQSIFQRLYRLLLGHPVARWLVILGSIAYLLSPIDISPDVIPIIGWIDDGLLAALLATGLTEMVLERRRAVKARKNQERSAAPDQTTVEAQATAVRDRPNP